MGAALVFKDFPNTERERIEQIIQDEIREHQIQDGVSGYTGTWASKSGVNAVCRIMGTREEAREYIKLHSGRSEPILAVRFKFLPTQVERKLEERHQPKIDAAGDAVTKAQKEFNDYEESLVSQWKERAQKKTCSNCGSSINPEFLEGADCPVCKESLMSKTQVKKLESLRNRIAVAQGRQEAAREALADAKNKQTQKSGLLSWLAGGWCAE